jgi:hypothetical protein
MPVGDKEGEEKRQLYLVYHSELRMAVKLYCRYRFLYFLCVLNKHDQPFTTMLKKPLMIYYALIHSMFNPRSVRKERLA